MTPIGEIVEYRMPVVRSEIMVIISFVPLVLRRATLLERLRFRIAVWRVKRKNVALARDEAQSALRRAKEVA